MDPLFVRHLLLDRGLRLVDVARQTHLPYDRLVRLINGYRRPRAEELKAIAGVLAVPVQALSNADADP